MVDAIASDYYLCTQDYCDSDRDINDGRIGSKIDPSYERNPFTPLTVEKIAFVGLLGVSAFFTLLAISADMPILTLLGTCLIFSSIYRLREAFSKYDYDNPSVRSSEIEKIRGMNLSEILDIHAMCNVINYDLLMSNRLVYKQFNQLGTEYITAKNHYFFEKNRLDEEYKQKIAPLKANVNMLQNKQDRLWDKKDRRRERNESEIRENVGLVCNTFILYNAKNELNQAEKYYKDERDNKLAPIKDLFYVTQSRLNAQFEKERKIQ